MQKLSLLPLLLVTGIGAVWASTLIFPNTSEFPRSPGGAGTISGALALFGADGTATNTTRLNGITASGYLQDRDCSTELVNKIWVGVDVNGQAICGRFTTPLVSIGRFTGLTAGVQVRHIDNSVVTPAIGDILVPGDIVQTNGGTATITFTDDLSVLRLDVATVVELSTGENTSGQSVAQAILSDGRLWGRILTSTGVNLGGGGMVAGVRGTSVSVEESAGVYTLAIIDSRSPTNAATLGSTIMPSAMGSTPPPILAGSQFIYASGVTTVPVANAMSKSDLLTSSAWIRENMQYDIIYLTGSLDQIRIAEYTAAEPENSEKNRLCINYSGSLDGKWMTDLYGCQSMDMFAMADFTRTGALTIAYKKSWEVLPTYLSQCGPGYTFDQCTHTLVASCITPGQHIVGYHGSCRDPRAYSLPEWTGYPEGVVQEGWWYDCREDTNDGTYGGADLAIYCAPNDSLPLTPIQTVSTVTRYPGQGYYINTTGQYISYDFSIVGGYNILAGKTITIELGGVVGSNLSPGWTKAYIADFGSEKWFVVNAGGKCLTTTVTSPTLCKTIGTVNSIVSWNGGITIPVTLSTIPTQMVVGNTSTILGGSPYQLPIGTIIKNIRIQ